jgi:hypothetical protein
MMPMKITGLLILLLVLILGCASSSKINAVDLGMSEAEVVAAMGEPDSTSAVENSVLLRYKLWAGGPFLDDYFVELKDGRVLAYGRVGDFGLGY